MAPAPQTTNLLDAAATGKHEFHWTIWVYAFLAMGFIILCSSIYFFVVTIRRDVSKSKVVRNAHISSQSKSSKLSDLVSTPNLGSSEIPQAMVYNWEEQNDGSARCRIVSLKLGTRDTDQDKKCALSIGTTKPCPRFCLVSVTETETSIPEDDSGDSQDASSLPSLVEDNDNEGSGNTTDPTQESLCNSPASSYSQISMGRASSQQLSISGSRPSLPQICIEDYSEPVPEDQEPMDSPLTAALSMLNLTMDFLPVPPPSFHAPRPRIDIQLLLQRDPVAELNDLLKLTEDAFDCTFNNFQDFDSDDTFNYGVGCESTSPLRISKC